LLRTPLLWILFVPCVPLSRSSASTALKPLIRSSVRRVARRSRTNEVVTKLPPDLEPPKVSVAGLLRLVGWMNEARRNDASSTGTTSTQIDGPANAIDSAAVGARRAKPAYVRSGPRVVDPATARALPKPGRAKGASARSGSPVVDAATAATASKAGRRARRPRPSRQGRGGTR